MMYLWLKYLHILSATILFGTGIGTAMVMLYGHLTKNITAMAFIYQYVVKVDWLFTGGSAILQLITGLAMVYIARFSMDTPWLLKSMIVFTCTIICWLIVVYLQIKIRNVTRDTIHTQSRLPSIYYHYFKWWFIFGWPAFIGLILIFYWMVMKPSGI